MNAYIYLYDLDSKATDSSSNGPAYLDIFDDIQICRLYPGFYWSNTTGVSSGAGTTNSAGHLSLTRFSVGFVLLDL